MTDTQREPRARTLVRWMRADRTGWTQWHYPSAIAADDKGRTECGIRYNRRLSEYAPEGMMVRTLICENCVRAMRTISEQPG